MKRLAITPLIEQHLRRALGPDVVPSSYAVFEATAFNTLPIRKRIPLYQDARADVAFLHEMAAQIAAESLPLQVMHSSEDLPSGRVFHGEVIPNGNDFDLRVLFFVDPAEADSIAKIETGTVDQVSVSIVPKQILNSVSGFDYLGEEATFEHIMTGDDGEGNILGQNGCYGRLVGLAAFHEMSLVGMGGATNARIIRRDQSYFGSSYQKLAASGVDPNAYVLTATFKESPEMDLKELVDRLEAQSAKIAQLEATNCALKTETETLGKTVSELETERDARVAAEDHAAAEAARDEAVDALREVAKTVQTASNQAEGELPSDVAGLKMFIKERQTDLASLMIAGGRAKGADFDSASKATSPTALSGFRTLRSKT